MGILSRIKNIVSSSINDLLDGVENPETALNGMIKDMEKSIEELRSNTASAMATAKLTQMKLTKSREASAKWQKNAENALTMDDEELARQALLRKKSVDETITMLEMQLTESEELSSRLKEELKLLENKLMEARIRKDSLIERHRVAESRKKIQKTSEKLANRFDRVEGKSNGVFEAYEGFGRFEEKIEKQLAEIEAKEELAGRNIDAEFEKLRRDTELEDELAELKAIVKKKKK